MKYSEELHDIAKSMEFKTIHGKDITIGHIGCYIKCQNSKCDKLHELTNDMYNSVDVAYWCDGDLLKVEYWPTYQLYCRIDRLRTMSVRLHEELWKSTRNTIIKFRDL